MNEIGGYKCLTPMRTAGSGSARWCFAARGFRRYFLKEFLTPVYPAQENTPLGQKQLERCQRFEGRKQRLYTALSCVIGDTLVPVVDFFVWERRYYAVSEAAPENCMTAEKAHTLSETQKRQLLYETALCLQRLHTQGIVHADLKPEHVLLVKRPDGYHPLLIDLDSGFLSDQPPEGDIEGDPVYLAPETFLRMTGQQAELDERLDTFAFGIMIHQIWTGELPQFDPSRYQYLYEAALDGGEIRLSDAVPEEWRAVMLRMLSREPRRRPNDARITALFEPQLRPGERDASLPLNGLSHLMRL